MLNPPTIKILGINFYNCASEKVIEKLKTDGGLLVVPSAPGLASIKEDKVYYNSLLNADVIIADSGYMALIWNLYHRTKIRRVSGLEFLIDFIADADVKATKEILLVDPREKEARANRDYLNANGFSITPDASYLAPLYDKDDVTDKDLLELIEARRPKYVLINLGGGIQEKLGWYLKSNLSYKPAIICTGAAIAFLTGHQAHIPKWADKLFLGWLFRCIEKPELYIPRYLGAVKLLPLLVRNGSNAPS